MDVERIQKINAMALELMKQGLASDREDAVNQAERIFKAKGATEYSSMRETMTKVEAEANHSIIGDSSNPIPADEIRTIMERNTTFMVKKLKEIEEKMAAMERDMASMASRMTFQQRPMEQPQQHAQPQQFQQQQPPQIQRGAGQQIGSSHPRSGNYNDSDVSIEKFFYMGGKK